MSIDEMQENLNKKYSNRKKGVGINITVPENIKAARRLDTMFKDYKMER